MTYLSELFDRKSIANCDTIFKALYHTEIWQFIEKGNTKYNSIQLFKDLIIIRSLIPEETRYR